MVTMVTNLVHSEVLCYVQNHFSSSSKENLITLLTGFYSEEEVGAAKQLLFSLVDDLPVKPDGLPRHIKRQANESKKQQDCDDLLKLFRVLDQSKVELPQFVACNLLRLPKVRPGEVDMYTMAVTITNLSQQIQTMTSRLTALESKQSSGAASAYFQEFPKLTETVTGHQFKDGTGTQLQGASASSVAPPVMGSWAGVTAALSSAEELKGLDKKKPAIRVPPAPIRVKGSKPATDVGNRLKTVPRRSVLAAYVGRLHPDTTEEDLHRFLSDEGVKGVVCKKLLSKDGTVYRTAAFYVTCCEESRDVFYNESCWPEGVELRDWVYRARE